MVSANENTKLRKMFAIIHRDGVIGRTELQKESGKMSISTYNKLKPYLLEKYESEIAFDNDRQAFYMLKPETEETQKLVRNFLKHEI